MIIMILCIDFFVHICNLFKTIYNTHYQRSTVFVITVDDRVPPFFTHIYGVLYNEFAFIV